MDCCQSYWAWWSHLLAGVFWPGRRVASWKEGVAAWGWSWGDREAGKVTDGGSDSSSWIQRLYRLHALNQTKTRAFKPAPGKAFLCDWLGLGISHFKDTSLKSQWPHWKRSRRRKRRRKRESRKEEEEGKEGIIFVLGFWFLLVKETIKELGSQAC